LRSRSSEQSQTRECARPATSPTLGESPPVVLGPYPDARWSDHRLIVGLDSYDIHTTRQAFESDRALTTAGQRVIRISWRQLQSEPAAIASELRRLLRSED
jgi:very-short-patch-repair endonuclease